MQQSSKLNQFGFSMVESTMALGFIAIVVMISLSINRMSNQSHMKMKNSDELISLNKEIKNLLSDTSTCYSSLYSAGQDVTAGYDVDEILDSSGNVRFAVGNTYNFLELESMKIEPPSLGTATHMNKPGTGFLTLTSSWKPTNKTSFDRSVLSRLRIWMQVDNTGEMLNCGSITMNLSHLWRRSYVDARDIIYMDGSVSVGTESTDASFVVQGKIKATLPDFGDSVELDPGDVNGYYLNFLSDKKMVFFNQATLSLAELQVRDLDLTGELINYGTPPACSLATLGAIRVNPSIKRLQYCGRHGGTGRWFTIEE
ncbi:MAG: hypothetical protein CME62_13105 [Halobacteriovoraceae bacterium]|nr:hypothetical protein [Halobacteriovoraceae bacterium]|tara:strand:- start:20866 stop:21804 length:939 start_codon:yes stop_codon:yes gene_type:complete